MEVAVRVRARRFVDDHGGDEIGTKRGGDEALLTAHAGAHHDNRPAIPVRPRPDEVDRAGVAQIHVEK